MTRKKRKILLCIVVILFSLVTPLILFYYKGYRFDFETKKFFQTGAFSFKVWPREAEVFVNGRLIKKNNFSFDALYGYGTIYIDNLLPKEYTVEIRKEGYLSWKKNLEIKGELATENKNIYLIPEKVKFNLLENGVSDYFISPDGMKAILRKNREEGWVLRFLDLEKNFSSHLLEEKDFLGEDEKVDFIRLEWSSDSKKILLRTKGKKNKYFIIEPNEGTPIIPLAFLQDEVSNVSFFPKNSQRIFFSQNLTGRNELFSADYKSREISDPILVNLLTFKDFDNSSLFWLSSKGYLYESNLSGNVVNQFNHEPILLDSDHQYRLFPFAEDKIFIKKEGELYFFDIENQSFEKILEGVKDIKISSDLKKIVYFTDHEVWVLFLKKIEEQPQRSENERLFLIRLSKEIGSVFWWTDHYLIFSAGNEIKIIEIDNRDQINIYDLGVFKNPELFWDETNRKLYTLSEGNFFSSDKLLP